MNDHPQSQNSKLEIQNSLALGRVNRLAVEKRTDFGYYLDGGPQGRILLPNGEVTFDGLPQTLTPAEALPHAGDTVPNIRRGVELNVFLYLDHDERLVATMRRPLAMVGDTARLTCAWTNQYGAFLAWGLKKDLFVPFHEQPVRMERGRDYLVRVLLDPDTHRIMASARGLEEEAPDPADVLLAYIRAEGGQTTLSDHSSPDDVRQALHMSKKAFKRAAGELYKRRLITISDEGMRLV